MRKYPITLVLLVSLVIGGWTALQAAPQAVRYTIVDQKPILNPGDSTEPGGWVPRGGKIQIEDGDDENSNEKIATIVLRCAVVVAFVGLIIGTISYYSK